MNNMNKKINLILMITTLLMGCSKNPIEADYEWEEAEIEESLVEEVEVIPVIPSYQLDSVAQIVDQYLIDQQFNGAALIASDGEVLLAKGYGYANLENQEYMTSQHKFQIASVSKSFVAVSILQLVEAGKLSLDQTLDTIFPEMPNGHRITIHHLLTHTSGLYSGDDLSDYTKETAKEDLTASAFRTNNLYHDQIGTRATYSNLGYDMLGLVVEEISGMPYEDYVDEYIFKPLEMNDSGLNMTGESLELMATSYNGNVLDGYNAKVFHPSFGYSSGGLHSTIFDLYKYDRALAENRLISQETYELMSETYSHIGSKGYGYGWYTNVSIADTVSHPGNLIGWHSMLLRANDGSLTVILLTNHDDSDMNMAYSIGNLIRANQN